MKTFICEICGDAYLGDEKPKQCPFCGAKDTYIKLGDEADPIVNKTIELSEVSRKNLEETLNLELDAHAIYICMANKADTYEIKAMYKRLAKVELEHASAVCKIMKIAQPETRTKTCDEDDVENFKKTLDLEQTAARLYLGFAKEAEEKDIKIFFTALSKVESEHDELIKNYLK